MGQAILECSTVFFLGLFQDGAEIAGYRIVQEGVPADAGLVDLRLDPGRATIQVVIESPQLPAVRPGEALPRLTPVIAARESR